MGARTPGKNVGALSVEAETFLESLLIPTGGRAGATIVVDVIVQHCPGLAVHGTFQRVAVAIILTFPNNVNAGECLGFFEFGRGRSC